MTIVRRLARAAIVAVGAAMLMVVSSPAATAAPRNGVCETGEICFYYLSNRQGSLSDFTGSIRDYGATEPWCDVFWSPALPGYRQCVKNNAESVWNRTSAAARVYVGSNYCGPFDAVAGNTWRNLSVTWRNNGSHKFAPFPAPC